MEPEDLKVLSAVAEDVDDALQPDKARQHMLKGSTY